MINQMNLSELKHYVTWEQTTKVSDGMGGTTSGWIEACKTWARILPTTAKEIRQSEQQVMVVSATIRIHYRPVFRSDWRMSYRGKYYSIVSVTNLEEADVWIDVNVRKVVA